ncbi:hypothetical protein [Hymenobacter mucosus]|uniref:hypothetical protein n=1 Tax=Hymenobacter mucosus TaxID=1411120 RepID=UPI00117B77CA|nr:hypothetical protein [Hymenobacter mucosus]
MLLLTAACQQKEDVKPVAAENADWITLEIPTILSGDEAYSIVGDLDKTLLVSTRQGVYVTSDQGKTWRQSRNFYGPVAGFLPRNDTIFALTMTGISPQGELFARYADMFTADWGKTWVYSQSVYSYRVYPEMQASSRQVQAAGITYRTTENTEPIPNSSSRLVLASDLWREQGTARTLVQLPARHYLKGLHVDAQQRLYVAASGLRFDVKTGQAINPTVGRPAIVYVSRRPLP